MASTRRVRRCSPSSRSRGSRSPELAGTRWTDADSRRHLHGSQPTRGIVVLRISRGDTEGAYVAGDVPMNRYARHGGLGGLRPRHRDALAQLRELLGALAGLRREQRLGLGQALLRLGGPAVVREERSEV